MEVRACIQEVRREQQEAPAGLAHWLLQEELTSRQTAQEERPLKRGAQQEEEDPAAQLRRQEGAPERQVHCLKTSGAAQGEEEEVAVLDFHRQRPNRHRPLRQALEAVPQSLLHLLQQKQPLGSARWAIHPHSTRAEVERVPVHAREEGAQD